ncbi:hypothetical protein KUTeg_007124 [Tegillarca granosa]|uniref:Biogenesis of lysosome-related organelles complex 1 subunit 3 n=1 Tax=Tegillarca granosa TaxID=220873 RepID=A0ABQ9FCD5_TEGGR|nr:hypothetical protein KUTeg_007124 [Tegillarca granosa]
MILAMAAIKTVVPGEASESDDEENPVQQSNKTASATATIVSGEASESEEEEEINTSQDNVLPPLKVDTEGKGDKDDITNGEIPPSPTTPTFKTHEFKPKYDTNMALRRHIVDTVHHTYLTAAKDLSITTQQLHKSQSAIMDIQHHMRLLTNDSFNLEDKIDIITSCKLLPDITIAVTQS